MRQTLRRLALTTTLFAALASDAAAETRTFADPAVKGVRLDWCRHWARDCGKPAADLFCREVGFEQAAQFVPAPGIGAFGVRTLVFGDGRICSHPTCSGFSAITCVKADPPEIRAVVPRLEIKPADQPPIEAILPRLEIKPADQPPVRSRDAAAVPLPRLRPVIIAPPPAEKGFVAFPGIRITARGGELIQCWLGTECTGKDVAIEPEFANQTVQFQANVTIDAAEGVVWQVADRPFPAFDPSDAGNLALPGLVASGRRDIPAGSSLKAATFYVDFAALAKALAPPRATYHVRAVPIAGGGATRMVGGPTNVITVAYGQNLPQPEPAPFVFHTPAGPRGPDPLFQISIRSFTPAVFEKASRWGCVVVTGYKPHTLPAAKAVYRLNREYCPKSYKGQGNQITSPGEFLEVMADAVTSGWDWLGGAFDDVKAAAVDVVMTYSGLNALCAEAGVSGACRTVASTALDAGLAAMGIPPTIPSYNELVDKGIDYAVEVAVEQVEATTGLPCVGPCEDAIRAGVGEFAETVKRRAANPGCVGAEEAHKHGREPLCIPDYIEARPAPGSVYEPPVLTVRVARRPEIPVPHADHPPCGVGADMVVRNFFPGGRVSVQPCTGCTVRSKDVAPQPIQATLFRATYLRVPLGMPPGTAVDVPVVFDRLDRFVFSWTRELYSGWQIEVQPSDAWGDWFTVYSGGTAELRALSGCAPAPDRLSVVLPR